MYAIPWGEVELEPEVLEWYVSLGEEEQARVGFHIDRLGNLGPLLEEPHARQLHGKPPELRFYLKERAIGITYWLAPNRRIILLTVFRKRGRRERREVRRAQRALERCMSEQHGVDGE